MAKKKNTPKKTKSKRKKRMPIILEIDDLYKFLNKVQINNKEYLFEVQDLSLSPIIDNIIKDSLLLFSKKTANDAIIYTVTPGDTEFCQELDVDEFEKDLFG